MGNTKGDRFRLGASGYLDTGIYTELSTSGTFTGGVSYSNGQWSPINPTPSLQFVYDPPVLDATLGAKAFAGVQFDLAVYDVVGPSFKPDGYLSFDARHL